MLRPQLSSLCLLKALRGLHNNVLNCSSVAAADCTTSFASLLTEAITGSSPRQCAWAATLTCQARPYKAQHGAAKRREYPLPPAIEEAINKALAANVKPPLPEVSPVQPRQMAFQSRRSGLIAIKAGMTQEWDEYGVRVPLTVLWVDDCQVCNHVQATEAHEPVYTS